MRSTHSACHDARPEPTPSATPAAIAGRAQLRMVVVDGAPAVRRLLPLSLSYDHRVIDGAAAARFTALLGQLLADLRRTML